MAAVTDRYDPLLRVEPRGALAGSIIHGERLNPLSINRVNWICHRIVCATAADRKPNRRAHKYRSRCSGPVYRDSVPYTGGLFFLFFIPIRGVIIRSALPRFFFRIARRTIIK